MEREREKEREGEKGSLDAHVVILIALPLLGFPITFPMPFASLARPPTFRTPSVDSQPPCISRFHHSTDSRVNKVLTKCSASP